MKNKLYLLLILLTIIIVSFPTICFSELKTVEGEYCEVYMGDMKNKKELDTLRKTVRRMSIRSGIWKQVYKPSKTVIDECISHVISNYLEKLVVISHTEKNRKICDRVKITFDPEVINEYLSGQECINTGEDFIFEVYGEMYSWVSDIDDVLTKKNDKWDDILAAMEADKLPAAKRAEVAVNYFKKEVEPVLIAEKRPLEYQAAVKANFFNTLSISKRPSLMMNIGLIIETKIPDIEGNKREQSEDEEENLFFDMIEKNKDKYKLIDRRHLSKVLEEQKLSSSGLTDSETAKLGKLLNLNIIVLRMIYEKSKVTKVLNVDTGEVLLFKTYKAVGGWVVYGRSGDGLHHFYNKSSITNVSSKIIRVWEKTVYTNTIQGDNKLNYREILFELDCVNNTSKIIKGLTYNYKGSILEDLYNPNPKIDQIYPGSIHESLLNQVCNK